MNFLVVGLGSMGKRRIRNLVALGNTNKNIFGFDLKPSRQEEAQNKYGIRTFNSFDDAIKQAKPNAIIISTSPESHMLYAYKALELRLPCFIEASVTEEEKIKELAILAKEKDVFFAPSCTMKYFQGPKQVKSLISDGKIGTPLFFNYQTGQHLEEWHPWEEVGDYYVSKRETSGAREIVPFELTWLCDLFGDATILSALKDKLSNMPFDFDDFYHFSVKFSSGVYGGIFVDVVTPHKASRRLHIVGSEGQIIFDANDEQIKYITSNDSQWNVQNFTDEKKEAGYINPEAPYIHEMRDFCDAISKRDSSLFPNTLENDYNILKLLLRIEEKSP